MSFNFPLGLRKYIVIVNLDNTEFLYNSFNRNFICDGILFVSCYNLLRKTRPDMICNFSCLCGYKLAAIETPIRDIVTYRWHLI